MERRKLTVSNPVMMARLTDKPMARAHAHVAAGRFAEAAGAFRAVLGIDSSVVPARLGLADALVARGQRGLAADGLVEAAETFTEREQHAQALVLYGKALAIEPERLQLHLDVALLERTMGRHEDAITRVEGLADRYMGMGRTDEAAELLRFVASWEEEAARAARPMPQVHTETVVCATMLIRPDGSLWLGPGPDPGVPEIDETELTVARAITAPIRLDEIEEIDPDMATHVKRSLAETKPLARRPMPSRALVERLRERAGLAPEPSPAVPQSTKAATKPIAIRRPDLGRAEREEEVTLRFHRPRASPRAAAY
jgi:tetratricopeptide (TPR) repeat protein